MVWACTENGRKWNSQKGIIKPTIIETIRLNRLLWFGHVQRMEGNGIPQKGIIREFGNNEAER